MNLSNNMWIPWHVTQCLFVSINGMKYGKKEATIRIYIVEYTQIYIDIGTISQRIKLNWIGFALHQRQRELKLTWSHFFFVCSSMQLFGTLCVLNATNAITNFQLNLTMAWHRKKLRASNRQSNYYFTQKAKKKNNECIAIGFDLFIDLWVVDFRSNGSCAFICFAFFFNYYYCCLRDQ